MKAPVQMMCVRCGSLILKDSPIERLKMKGTRYAHVGCAPGHPPGEKPKGGPAPHVPVPVPGGDAPKGWVTEDKFSLPEDAIKRLRGQDAPDGGTDRPVMEQEEDDRVDVREDVRGRQRDTDREGDGEGEQEGKKESDDGPGGDQPDGDGSGLDGDEETDVEGDDEGDGDGQGEEGEEGDGTDEGEEESDDGKEPDQSGEKKQKQKKEQKPQKPPAQPKRNAKLEDLPDDLLLKLAQLAAEMATAKLKGTIEPRLSRILAEVAEPLTAKMAGEFQKKMGDSVRDQLTKAVGETRKEAAGTIETLRKEIDRRVEEEIARLDGLRPVVHKIQGPGDWEKEFPETELFHFAFDETLKLCGAGFDVFTPGPTGCLARGTPVMMHDGTTRVAEDVRVGDRLMGPDSKPRIVLSLARGREMMYQVTPIKGEPYTVNESHILSLKVTPEEGGRKHRVVNLTVREYLNRSEWFRHIAKGYRVGVEFDYKPVPVDPYFLGLWLGDGDSDSPTVTTRDSEIMAAVSDVANSFGLRTRTYSYSGSCPRIRIVDDGAGPAIPNKVTNALRGLGLMPSKFVPESYRVNSRTVRLAVLAGLLDSDGHMSKGRFEFVNKSEQLARDVVFLARSLGLAAYVAPCRKASQRGTEGDYWRVMISGDCSVIPTRVRRKRSPRRKQKKDVLVTGIDVKPVGVDNYFGFTVSGDHLFLLGDFTVTHNCGKTHMFAQIARALGLDYGLVSGTGGVTETELFGNATPNLSTGENVYQATEFVNLYENGGLFLLDEADGMDANCLLKVNAAIANGYCTIPKRLAKPRAKRHPNFIFALAANTWGHGATRLYCGRNKLDEATLDRFRGGSVPMDYDPNIERRLVGDQSLYRKLAGWRTKITEHGLPRVLSTRFMVQAVKLKAMGYDDDGIAKKLVGGWTPGEVEKVIGHRL